MQNQSEIKIIGGEFGKAVGDKTLEGDYRIYDYGASFWFSLDQTAITNAERTAIIALTNKTTDQAVYEVSGPIGAAESILGRMSFMEDQKRIVQEAVGIGAKKDKLLYLRLQLHGTNQVSGEFVRADAYAFATIKNKKNVDTGDYAPDVANGRVNGKAVSGTKTASNPKDGDLMQEYPVFAAVSDFLSEQ